jgi:DNA/RNA-binding domain of Phe-tRNA-synthetase-like protein
MFEVSETWRAAYPTACAGVLAMRDVSNPPQHPELDDLKMALESQLRADLGGLDRGALAALPVLQAYEAYYRRFKKTYHVQLQLESILWKGKSIPRVAALVEAMFMAELKNLLLTAGHDLDAIQPPITLDVAQGDEQYTLLRGEAQTLKSGDMLMRDLAGVISSILYGPDQRTQITAGTRRVTFTVYAPPGIGEAAVAAHLHDIQGYVQVIAPQAGTELLEVFGAQRQAT